MKKMNRDFDPGKKIEKIITPSLVIRSTTKKVIR